MDKEFESVLNFYETNKEDLFISLAPPFDIKFEIGSDRINKFLSDNDFDKGSFDINSNHITVILLAILRKDENGFIKAYISDIVEDKKSDEYLVQKNKLVEEIKLVKEKLFNSDIQDRYDLKINSKAPSFTNLDWDIKIKVVDSKLEDIHLPYATCKFSYQKEFEYSPLTILGSNAFNSLQINFSVEDIDYIIKVFSNIKGHLAKQKEASKQ